MKRNSSIPFIPSSEEAKAVLIFQFFCNGSRKLKEAAPFLSPPLQFLFYHFLFYAILTYLIWFVKRNGKSINLSGAPMTSAIPDSIFYY
jgi:hypothetical protein